MFFLTQIKKADTFSAVDVAGRRLTFAGNLPCQAGDFVWTDGRVIFGNMQNQSSPYFFDNSKGGVPYVGDLRGYFDNFANFKNFNVANDNWIVNDDKNFAHGNANLYDAEISYDGDLLTAELVSDSLIDVYKNGKFFYSVDANSIAGLNFITDSSISATYNNEFVNFKLLRDGTYDALVKPVASVDVDSSGDDSGGAGGESQSVVFNELLTRAEFLETDFPFDHSEYGGHPLLKKALLDFLERCLFADFCVTDDSWDAWDIGNGTYNPPDNLVYGSQAYQNEYVSATDRNYRLGAHFLNGHISKIHVEIRQTTQGSTTPTINIQGGISRVSNGTVTAKKKGEPSSLISGYVKGNFGESGNVDDIDYVGGNFFNVSNAIGTADFDENGNYILRQTRVKKYLIQPFESREECLWLNPYDGNYYPLPEYYKESSWNRIWRDPNGRSIPLHLLYCPFESTGNNGEVEFFFYETQDAAAINSTVADDEYGLTYRFRLVYDIAVDDSTTTITTPPFMLIIKGKYKRYSYKTIDTSGGGSGEGGGSGFETPILDFLTFPVQDGFYFDEQFHAVFDSDSNIVFAHNNFSISDKLSATKLKNGNFLVGKKDSALFLVNDNHILQSFDDCNNFRLRFLNNIAMAKK